MKPGTIVGIAAIFLLLPLLGKIVSAPQLTFEFDGVKNTSFNFSQVKFTLRFVVLNPSNASYMIKAITGDISLAGKSVGYVNMFQLITIPAASQAYLEIPVVLSNSAVLQALTTGQGLTLTFKGSANIENNLLPINQTFSM